MDENEQAVYYLWTLINNNFYSVVKIRILPVMK